MNCLILCKKEIKTQNYFSSCAGFIYLFFIANLSVFSQEYGINKVEKLDIAYAYCLPLVRKIQLDLQRTHEDESVNKLHPL